MSAVLQKLGKYQIRRELGSGAMGVVYEAFDPSIERVVALKTIRRDQVEKAEAAEMIERFRREAKAAGRLNHPNIVAIYDFGEDEGTLYIAMEFVSGRELKSHFEAHERFPVPEVARIMGQLLRALDYAHANGIVHRDIKPANIILLPDGQVKVADFGIARIESSQFTQVGTVLGTPAYMSPEQFMGQVVDRRSDIYSAGVVLYEFLTAERPFTGSATTIMHKVLNERPAPPSMLNVQVPAPFDAIVARAMAKRPDERFQTAREFAEAIEKAAAGQAMADADATIVATDATLVSPVSSAPAAPAKQAAGASPAAAAAASSSAASNRSSAKVLAGIVAGIVVLAAAGYLGLRYQMQREEPTVAAASAPAAQPASAKAPAAPPSAAAEPGMMIISAVGLADPADGKYQADKAQLALDLVADSKSQLVEKAIALYLDRASLVQNYEALRERVMSKSGGFISRVLQESEPQLGKDGLMRVTTQAAVKVNAVQKSLNEMSREERIQFIRNNGDPRISVSIAVRDEGSQAHGSQVAENLLKDRIKSFGFRVVSDDSAAPYAQGKSADFAVVGEAQLKKLSARLAASGITVEKYLLTSWTVKCFNRQTGEEIYHNNKIPVAQGSWASQEQALDAIGGKIGDEFSRDFFLQNFTPAQKNVALKVEGLPADADDVLLRELVALRPVLGASRTARGTYGLQIAGIGTSLPDLVQAAILKPLNAKLGQACFSLGAATSEEVAIRFDPACGDKAVLARFETNPPAALYDAPPARQSSVLRDPASVKKLRI